MALAVARLFVHPIKSCAGIELREAELVATGIAHDRRWMVTEPDGTFLSQREVPGMALIRVAVGADALTVAAPNLPPLSVPFAPAGAAIRATVWSSTVPARLVSDAADAWFTRALGQACRLVYMPDETHRALNPLFARPDDRTGFSDGYPLLLIGQGSLDELNRRIGGPPAPLPPIRFRPNIVVTGAAPFAEDGWQRLRIGGQTFRVVKPCERCAITTVDPATGEFAGKEPLRTLATFRRGAEGGVFFGQNVIHDGPGRIRVGDAVEVLG